MKLEENLDIFTKGEFSSPALIDGVEVWGIFDEEYAQAFGINTLNSEGRAISFQTQTSEITEVNHGSRVELNDRVYEVIQIQPIDDGKLTDLILKEA
ncbi:MAG: hypothetical protein QNJ55_15725 [Xenococcus sp. MO_188.B8]|nr:hypothetical protein [Xenococcus sp. MO_188.B8]